MDARAAVGIQDLCDLWKDVFTSKSCLKEMSKLIDGVPVYVPHDRLIVMSDCNVGTRQVELNYQRITDVADRPINSSAFSICYDLPNRYIYLIGGTVKREPIAQCYKLDVFTFEWIKMPDLNEARYRTSTFITQDKRYLYCLKGFDIDGKQINNFERLDLTEASNDDSWVQAEWELINIEQDDILNKLRKGFITFGMFNMKFNSKWIDKDNVLIFGGVQRDARVVMQFWPQDRIINAI